LLQIVVDHRECDASLKIGEAETRPLLRRILVAICHGSARRAGLRCQHGVELPK